MKIKLFEGSEKEALEKRVNEWLMMNYRVEVVDIKIARSEEEDWGKNTIMVIYK